MCPIVCRDLTELRPSDLILFGCKSSAYLIIVWHVYSANKNPVKQAYVAALYFSCSVSRKTCKLLKRACLVLELMVHILKVLTSNFGLFEISLDRLCGLVVRVPGYRSRGLGFDSWHYQIF
jgi:ABC-type enterobactin transport system permease subunit